jgi:uncharacterized protein (UPF0332 family)
MAAKSLEQSQVWLEEARVTLAAGALRSSIIAVYNVYFHAARAVLFQDGLREKSHVCIELYLESYVTRGLLEDTWLLLFGHLRSTRHQDQYSFGPIPSREEIEEMVNNATAFCSRMERLVGAIDEGK